MKLILIYLISFPLFAQYEKYTAFSPFKISQTENLKEQSVINMGRYRSQDAIGNCYTFTSAKLMEHICRNDRTCTLGNDEISPLALYSTDKNGILMDSPGGSISNLLKRFGHSKKSRLSVIKESCAPFDQTVYRKWYENNTYVESEYVGLEFLNGIFSEVQSSDCINCEMQKAKQIKSALPNLSSDINNIYYALIENKKAPFKTFLDDLLIQNQCHLDVNKISIPRFQYKSKASNEFKNPTEVVSLLKNLIDKNTPVDITLCLQKYGQAPETSCPNHAVIVNGYREYCDRDNKCRYEMKVHNSWGASWQQENNDGWVDADILAHHVLFFINKKNEYEYSGTFSSIINWLEPVDKQNVINNSPSKASSFEEAFKDLNQSESSSDNYFCRKSGQLIGSDNPQEIQRLKDQGYECYKI